MIIFIASTPRTGGHLLLSLLSSTGICAKTAEFSKYLWERYSDFPFEQINNAPNTVIESAFDRIREDQQRDTSAWVFKISVHGINSIVRYLKLKDIPLNDVNWIYLYRRNIVEQSISYQKACRTNQWELLADQVVADESDVNISIDAINAEVCRLASISAAWQTFLEHNGLNPFCIAYEEFRNASDWLPCVTQIFEFFDITYPLPLSVSTEHQRQSTPFNKQLHHDYLGFHLDQIPFNLT